MEPITSDDQFTPDFARSFNAALTGLIWIVLGVGLLYGVALVWFREWALGVLGMLSIIIIPIAWHAKRRIVQGHIRTSLVLFISAIVFILSSALLLVRGMDVAIITGFSIPMVLSALLRTPRLGAGIALFAGCLYTSVVLLAPILPWQPLRLDQLLGTALSLMLIFTTLGVLGLISWQIVSVLQRALGRAHLHLAAQQQAESALRESQAGFRSAFDYAAIGMALVALDGRWLQVNQVLCNLVGYTEAELRARSFQTITHPDDLAVDEAYVQQVLDADIRTYQMEKRYIHKDGHIVWVLLSVSLVRDAQEQPDYFIAQAQDIMARKHAEIELTRSYANNSALLEALPDTLYRFGADGTLQDYKAGYVDALTIPSALCVGQHVTQLFLPAIASQLTRALTDVLATERIQVIEQAILIQKTMHDYEFRIVSSGTDTALVLVRDITERKTIERLKDEFVATVSHELRTPLTAIHGALGLVNGGVAGVLPTQARTMVEIALNNSDRLIRLINDLLDLQKIDAGQFDIQRAPLQLLPLLERTIATNASYGQQFGVTFRVECASTIIVHTDADRLMQVLTNLLSNATKFSPAGDTVIVQVTRQQQVRIAVIDHGPGIPLAFQSKLFQKFAQADGSNTRRTGGTGLGLSIAKKLIERLGGRIGFETTAGVGTTFYVELPEWRAADAYSLDPVGH